MDHPYPWLQDVVDRVPDAVQPLIVGLAAAVPYVEGEGAAVLGILAGIDPVVAGLAAVAGNVLCVVAVVLLGSRARGAVQARRAARAATRVRSAEGAPALVATGATSGPPIGPATGPATAGTRPTAAHAGTVSAGRGAVTTGAGGATGVTDPARAAASPAGPGADAGSAGRGSKGRARLRRWMLRFGVPGASLLAPLALPTMLTAAFFVASGVRKEWVILWQVVAIVVWTGLVVAAATGLVAALGW